MDLKVQNLTNTLNQFHSIINELILFMGNKASSHTQNNQQNKRQIQDQNTKLYSQEENITPSVPPQIYIKQNSNAQLSPLAKFISKNFSIITVFLSLILAAQIIFFVYFSSISKNSYTYQNEQLQQINKQLTQKLSITPASFNHSAYQPIIHKLSHKFQLASEYVSQYLKKYKQMQITSLQTYLQTQKLSNKIQQVQSMLSTKPQITKDTRKFIFPKIIWRFNDLKAGQSEYLNDLYRKNNQQYAAESQYIVYDITQFNYFYHIPAIRVTKLTSILDILDKRISLDHNNQDLRNNYYSVKKSIIMLFVLEQNGGIAMSQNLAFVQNLKWLQDVSSDEFLNGGVSNVTPKIFGFQNISKGSFKMKYNRKVVEHPVDRYLRKYIGLLSYFLVAVPHCEFISDLIDQISYLIQFPKNMNSYLKQWEAKNQIDYIYQPISRNFYTEYFQLACIITLLKKQFQVRQLAKQYYTEREIFGFDQYGLLAINSNIGSERVKMFFENNQDGKIFHNLAKFDLQQFVEEFGPMKYLHKLPLDSLINNHLLQCKKANQTIIIGSYFHKFLFNNSDQPFLVQNPQTPFIDTNASTWDKLTKRIWVYWDNGLQNSTLINQLCVDNLRRYAKQSNFSLTVVTNDNLNQFLDKNVLERIFYAIQHQAAPIPSKYIKYDLVRLALILKYGGVYMDSSYIALQNFDWLVNIGRYPSQYIFNRYGDLPKVLLFFNPHYGSPFKWVANKKTNTKEAWHLGYQNSFIAAVKNCRFIKQWFQFLLRAIQTPYQQIQQQYKRVGIHYDRWSSFHDLYLLPMDTIKYVLGYKQIQLSISKKTKITEPCDFYKLWSINGNIGQQKLSSHTSFQGGGHDNHYIRLFPQQKTERLLSKVHNLIKLFNYPVRFLDSTFSRHVMHNTLAQQFHQDSIFMKYLYNQTRHQITKSKDPHTKGLKLTIFQ